MKFLLDTDHISILQKQSGPEYAAMTARMNPVSRSDLAFCIISFHEQVLGCNAYIAQARTAPDVVRGYRIENLALACPRCNAAKWTHVRATDPLSGDTVPLFNPRTQDWVDHFRWLAADPALLEPFTPEARATAALLELNGLRHVEVRRWLMVLGLHPPPVQTGQATQ
jgi:hypothetical protein